MLGFSPLASAPLGDDSAITANDLNIDKIVSSSISSAAPVVTTPTVAYIYNLSTIAITSGSFSVASSDVVQNVITASTDITVDNTEITQVDTVFNCVFNYSEIVTGATSVGATSVGTTIVPSSYNLLPAEITSGACVVAPVDVVPNVILQSTAIVSVPSIVSNASAVLTYILESTNIIADTTSVTSTDATIICYLFTTPITLGVVSVGSVDVVPNVVLGRSNINTGAAQITSVDSIINIIATANYVTVATPEVEVSYTHIKGPFNPDYAVKRTYIVLSESRAIFIPKGIVNIKTMPHVLGESRTISVAAVL